MPRRARAAANEISRMADFWLTRVRAGSRVERRLHMQVPS